MSNSTRFDSPPQGEPHTNPFEIKYLWASAALTVEKADNDMLLDALEFVKEQCELLPDRPTPQNSRLWTETINLIYERMRVELALRNRIEVKAQTAQRGAGEGDGE